MKPRPHTIPMRCGSSPLRAPVPPCVRASPTCLRASRPGLTILEAVVALVIIGVGLPPMLWALRQAHAHRADAVLASNARWLAAERLEDVIADRHSNTRGYSYLVNTNYPVESPVPGFTGFTRTVSIAETGADLITSGIGYKTATVSVTYSDARNVQRTISLATIITDYTP